MPTEPARAAAMDVTAGLFHSLGLDALEKIEATVDAGLGRLGSPETSDPLFRQRLLEYAAGQLEPGAGLAPAEAPGGQSLRNLLHVCVHPALPPDRQRTMLLRLAFWLPCDAIAKILESGPATVGMHLRQSYRRLRAVARRGDHSVISRRHSRGGILIDHFAALRRRAVAMRRRSLPLAAIVDHDVRAFAGVLADTEGGPSRGQAHAFLAELLLGEERDERARGERIVPTLQGAEADPAADRVGRGLRHLMAAQELGVDSRFIWLARIHATYLLESDAGRIDWQRLVGLYERLLQVSDRSQPDQAAVDTPAA